tara:strand:- start:29 stop:166 length:138 start_codon:yes stop_codon:yes gene_type:complete
MTPEEKKEKKAKERKELMKKFLAKGGKIEKIPYSVTKEMLKRGQL